MEDEIIRSGWEDLANAIIAQATEDYLQACRAALRKPWEKKYAKTKRSIESFFRSGWFRTLSPVDGKELLEKIRKENGL